MVAACQLPQAGLDLLRQRFVVDGGEDQSAPDWWRERAVHGAALVTDPSLPVDPRAAGRRRGSLKVVANFAVGYDNIDVEAAQARRVRVTNTPGVLSNATAGSRSR